MKSFLALFAILALAQAKSDLSDVVPLDVLLRDDFVNSRITGGQEVVPHSIPYQAALILKFNNKTGFCGGSLISSRFVLTAAHCIQKDSEIEVILGAHNFRENEPTQKRYVSKKFIVHDKWNPLLLTADIALIELPEEVEFTNEIQPVQLPRYSDAEKELAGVSAVVSGWGLQSDKAATVSPVLRSVESAITTETVCKIFYFGVPGKQHVCLSGKKGKSSCKGDSGGPLVSFEDGGRPTQQGIVSFGIVLGCQVGWPSVYTRAASYLSWIHEKTGIPIRD